MYRIDGKFIKYEHFDNIGNFSARVVVDENDVSSIKNLKDNILDNIINLNIDGLDRDNVKVTEVQAIEDTNFNEKRPEFDDFKICIDNTCLNIEQIKKFKKEIEKYDCLQNKIIKNDEAIDSDEDQKAI
tara:strand:- start:2630 stop:3016 length:387 start_codon:yes stop_codon:yes gene_type:complete